MRPRASTLLTRYCAERGYTWDVVVASLPYMPIELSIHSLDIQGDVLVRLNGWNIEHACSRALERFAIG